MAAAKLTPDKPHTTPTRRDFLKRAGVAGALGAAGCAQPDVPPPSNAERFSALEGAERESQGRAMRGRRARAIPARQGNGLNLIVIVADTWRTDHCGFLGGTGAKTPALDALATQSIVYENNWADGLPTIPARRVYHTGHSILPAGRWLPLPAEDVTMAQILGKAGYYTGLIADVYHYFKPDMNMHVGFDTWEWIRGQEGDAWQGGPREQFQPKQHMPADLWNESYDRKMRQYMMNTKDMRREDDYFCARTARSAMRWLDDNHTNSPFMLWVEMFDPHEPWDPPRKYADMYFQDWEFDRPIFGYGVQDGNANPDFAPHLPWIKGLYRGNVTLADVWIGHLLAHVERLNLLDDTIICFTSDHGTLLGEFGMVQKSGAQMGRNISHVPCIIRHPDRSTAGTRCSELTNVIDYGQTFCSMLGMPDQPTMTGQDVFALASTGGGSAHPRTFSRFGQYAAVRDRQWHYHQHIDDANAGLGPVLYDLVADPEEQDNVAVDHPDVVANLRQHLSDRFAREMAVPPPV